MTVTGKKLIEVALPLVAINTASAREKSIRHGHPSTLHLWWARRPLAAARAVIFAQMVDDPSEYAETLRQDAKLRRRAESALNAKKRLWDEAKELHDRAAGSGLQVPEPGPEPTLLEVLADQERQRLFGIIENLVLWENTTNESVLQQARDEIWASWRRACTKNIDHPHAKELFDRHALPGFHDPFAGGGAIPLEAQRLGLRSYASDLNPVPVLINKGMIEIPPRFANRPPVNPDSRTDSDLFARNWKGAQGLAADVRYYGEKMQKAAEARLAPLYPKITVTDEMARGRDDLRPYVGRSLTIIAWLWARTVKSPNPAFAGVHVPLITSYMLATKPGKEAYVEPVVGREGYSFTVKSGKPRDIAKAKSGTKLSRGANFECLMSGTAIAADYIRAEGMAGRMGSRLMAIVAEGDSGRVYLAPTPEQEAVAMSAVPEWEPVGELVEDARAFTPSIYGMKEWRQLFTTRQLEALSTLATLVHDARALVVKDASSAFRSDGVDKIEAQVLGAAYGDAVALYLGAFLSRLVNLNNALCQWRNDPAKEHVGHLFARQAIPMVWDFAEANPIGPSAGGFEKTFGFVPKVLEWLPASGSGFVTQADAATQSISVGKVVSTDPPYYDNVPYADLSDFFYVWLRRSLRTTFPDLFATVAVPKAEELVATSYRHNGRAGAEEFFLGGMTEAMRRLAEQSHPAFPVTIYYAFKQAETDRGEATTSTGWETFLDAVIRAGFAISGTWPMRTELGNRMRGMESNALASSIVLVCRRRDSSASIATRREFITVLRAELPTALAHLQRGNIAPVDLAQAAIGPGMAVYTRFAEVLDAEGKPLRVRDALALINQVLDEALAEQEGDFDPDTRWALAWFEQSGFTEGEFGVADVLARAKNTAVQGLAEAGIAHSSRGRVRLLSPAELPSDWDPAMDKRVNAWEIVHHLVRALEAGGESAAAELVAKLGAKAEVARELAYRLYTLSERKKRASDALSYNGLVQSFPEILRLANEQTRGRVEQGGLFSEGGE
jgi:putative DNA methylase